jgi:hypothetical protein
MTHDEAVELLTRAIVETHGLGGLRGAPSREQSDALRSVEARATAPEPVCLEIHLGPGSTWGAVVGQVAADASGPDGDDLEDGWTVVD